MISERDMLNVAISVISDLQEKAVCIPKPRGRPLGSHNRPKTADESLPDAKV
jgi:hypothetical protein